MLENWQNLEFANEEESAYCTDFMKLGNLICFEPEPTALDKAREFAWDAMDEFDPKKRKELAQKALDFSEDCADAYCILGGLTRSINLQINKIYSFLRVCLHPLPCFSGGEGISNCIVFQKC